MVNPHIHRYDFFHLILSSLHWSLQYDGKYESYSKLNHNVLALVSFDRFLWTILWQCRFGIRIARLDKYTKQCIDDPRGR